MKDVSIIYVNYKTKEITLNSISSVIQHTKGITYEIILVDNNSKDGTVEETKERFPEVIVIESDKNLGFAGGCNLGSKYANGKYILFLNTDTILIDNSIKLMFEFMEKNKEYGAIGVLLVDDKNNITQSWGDFLPFSKGIKEFGILPILPKSVREKLSKQTKSFEEFENKFFKGKDVMEVDYIIGADLFIRKDLFEEIGKFDERFFMYSEEADLQIRLKKKGYKIGVIKGTRIIHLESKSFKVSNSKRTMKMVSFLRYLKKNFFPLYILLKPAYLFYSILKFGLDLILKEYTNSENLIFLKSILLETFEFVVDKN